MTAVIGFVDVYSEPSAPQVLYELLGERKPYMNISHKEMPSYEAHCTFFASRPYEAWYLIAYDAAPAERARSFVGTIYLTRQREVGLFVFERHRGRGFGRVALAALRLAHPGRILANISPRNEASQHFFARNGAKLIQMTYELP